MGIVLVVILVFQLERNFLARETYELKFLNFKLHVFELGSVSIYRNTGVTEK